MRARAPLHTTTARAKSVSGAFEANLSDGMPTGPVSGWAEVRLRSFSSGNPLLDMSTLRHLGARHHPVARFTLDRATPAGAGTVTVAGTLDFHGTTREVTATATVAEVRETVTVSGTWTLRQSDFGLKPPRLAMLKVDDDVEVTFELVAGAAR